jgi:polysaccharide export outer membrane protein
MKTFFAAFRMLVAAAVAAAGISSSALAQDSYRIRPGDTLRVEVFEDPSLNRDVIVLPDGRISFPFAGTVQAGGLSIPDVQSALAQGIASNFANTPNVFVSIPTLPQAPAAAAVSRAAATISVYFVGEFAAPGKKDVAPGTTFLQALAQSGGFSNFAAEKRVQLRRPDQSVYTIDYRAVANGTSTFRDVTLQNGDVILAPQRRLFE